MKKHIFSYPTYKYTVFDDESNKSILDNVSHQTLLNYCENNDPIFYKGEGKLMVFFLGTCMPLVEWFQNICYHKFEQVQGNIYACIICRKVIQD